MGQSVDVVVSGQVWCSRRLNGRSPSSPGHGSSSSTATWTDTAPAGRASATESPTTQDGSCIWLGTPPWSTDPADMARDVQITFDCADPAGLARFWVEALGYRMQDPPTGFESWEQALSAMGVPPERRNDASAVVDPEGNEFCLD